MKQGKVYLVGAGPGDVGLITVKGFELLKQAEVLAYDRLLDESFINLIPPEAERIYVGKTPMHHTLKQEEINNLLVKKAKEGKRVVRLKGGDPFLLGRGGEEAQALAEGNVPFEVVPGVPSVMAVPAYAGIPVTHRGLASSMAIITGHEDPQKGTSSLSWERLSTGADTLVFLMGARNLPQIASKLMEHGRFPSTPVALIKEGTGPHQEIIVGTLADIVSKAEEKDFSPPAVIVIGEVVKLREKLHWFEDQPLFGKRVLVTRAKRQSEKLVKLLQERGAQPVEMPLIEIKAALGNGELNQAIMDLDKYQWIVFTSVNGVEAFFSRMYALRLDARWLKDITIGAIGPATNKALEERGLRPDFLPHEYTSDGFLEAIKGRNISGHRFLLPRTDKADKRLAQGLVELGAEVHEVTAYRVIPSTEINIQAKEMLLTGDIDVVTFTSSSMVRNLVSLLKDAYEALSKTKIACIGPKTAATAEKEGLRVDIVAKEHTIPGLVKAMEEYFIRGR